jgi:hypothetical protein
LRYSLSPNLITRTILISFLFERTTTSLRVNNLVNPLAVLVRSVGNVTTSPLFFSWSLNITSGSTRAIQQESWRLQIYRDDQETLICDENSTSLNYALQSVYACSNELSQLSGGTRLATF